MGKKSLPDVIRKDGAWGIVLWVANYSNPWKSLKGLEFFFIFVTQCNLAIRCNITYDVNAQRIAQVVANAYKKKFGEPVSTPPGGGRG